MPEAEFYRARRVVRKADEMEGTVTTVSGDSLVVQWDDKTTTVVPMAQVRGRGRGSRPGHNAKVPRPAPKVEIERIFSKVVSAEMERLNISQRQLAKLVGKSRRTIQRTIASNGHKQTLETLEAFARALGISPSRFWNVEVGKAAA
jgi:ribosome-binding protein aMBF1 (putative translation factor)